MQGAYLLPRKSMVGRTNVSVDSDQYDLIKIFFNTNKEVLKNKYGITTIAEFYDKAVVNYIEKLKSEIEKLEPYEHINAYEDRVVLKDIKMGTFIHIYFREDKGSIRLNCSYDSSFDCEHIDYCWEIDTVREMLETRGIKCPKSS